LKIILLLISFLFLYSHPVNLTKMSWDLNRNIFKLRFVSYNLNKPFKTEVDAENFDKQKVYKYTLQHLKIEECKLIPLNIKISKEIVVDEYFKTKCKKANNYKIFFDMFFKYDKTQRGVLKVKEKNESVYYFSVSHSVNIVKVYKKSINFIDFIKMGIYHILNGYDHQTFLLMLLLAAIVMSENFLKCFINIVEIATAFTISHSISLSLSAFHIVNPPENIIEILIAFSIFLTAVNNFTHIVKFKYEWLLAFVFGFIHGFGFAEALENLHLELKDFIKVVFGFNLGVEIGQFIIILFLMPILYFLIKRNNKLYKLLTIIGGILALLWMIDRITGIGYMPF